MATSDEVGKLLTYLLAAYPGKFQVVNVGEFTTKTIFAEQLADVPADAALAAVRQYVSEAHEWPPNAGQLRERAMTFLRPALPAWTDAWAEVLGEIKRVGHWGQPRYSHPLIAQAADGLGDWQTLCEMEVKETATWRAQFRQSYEGYASRAESETRLLPQARALAIKNGALAAPVEDAPPDALTLLPPSEPIDTGEYIDFAARLRQWREDGMKARSEQGRKVAEEAANG